MTLKMLPHSHHLQTVGCEPEQWEGEGTPAAGQWLRRCFGLYTVGKGGRGYLNLPTPIWRPGNLEARLVAAVASSLALAPRAGDASLKQRWWTITAGLGSLRSLTFPWAKNSLGEHTLRQALILFQSPICSTGIRILRHGSKYAALEAISLIPIPLPGSMPVVSFSSSSSLDSERNRSLEESRVAD